MKLGIKVATRAWLMLFRGSKLMKIIKDDGALNQASTVAKAAAQANQPFTGERVAALGTRLASQFKDLSAKEAMILLGPDLLMGEVLLA